jgi:hypothetical protein
MINLSDISDIPNASDNKYCFYDTTGNTLKQYCKRELIMTKSEYDIGIRLASMTFGINYVNPTVIYTFENILTFQSVQLTFIFYAKLSCNDTSNPISSTMTIVLSLKHILLSKVQHNKIIPIIPNEVVTHEINNTIKQINNNMHSITNIKYINPHILSMYMMDFNPIYEKLCVLANTLSGKQNTANIAMAPLNYVLKISRNNG